MIPACEQCQSASKGHLCQQNFKPEKTDFLLWTYLNSAVITESGRLQLAVERSKVTGS